MDRVFVPGQASRGISSKHVFLAGFSQGGAVAYLSGLTHPEPLAGIIALSTYIPSLRLVSRELAEANHRIPIFAAHGSEDDVVSLELGRKALELLHREGLSPVW